MDLTDFSSLRAVIARVVGSIKERSRQRLFELESGKLTEKSESILDNAIITKSGMFEILEDGTIVRFLVHVPQGPKTWGFDEIPHEELLKDQKYWHKYHIFKCRTVSDWQQNMRKSSRKDGKMVYMLKNRSAKSGEYLPQERKNGRELQLCSFCRKQLPWKYIRKFDLTLFMQTTPFKEEFEEISGFRFEDEIPNNYGGDWPQISKKVKELRKWTCELCKTYHGRSTATKKYLQVHHTDRRRDNCSYANLQALCLICHAKQHPENALLRKSASKLVQHKNDKPSDFEP
jgi:hypothetical protein